MASTPLSRINPAAVSLFLFSDMAKFSEISQALISSLIFLEVPLILLSKLTDLTPFMLSHYSCFGVKSVHAGENHEEIMKKLLAIGEAITAEARSIFGRVQSTAKALIPRLIAAKKDITQCSLACGNHNEFPYGPLASRTFTPIGTTMVKTAATTIRLRPSETLFTHFF